MKQLMISNNKRTFTKLPFRISIQIFQEYFILDCENLKKDNSINEFFGRFKKDPTKTVWCLFKNIGIDKIDMKSYPFQHINYVICRGFWIKLEKRFLSSCKYLKALKNVVMEQKEDLNSPVFHQLEELDFQFDDFGDEETKIFNNKMQKLKKLAVLTGIGDTVRKRVDLELRKLEFFHFYHDLPSCYTFKSCTSLKSLFVDSSLIGDHQIVNLLKIDSLDTISFQNCTFESKFNLLFTKKHLKSIDFSGSIFDYKDLEKVEFSQSIKKINNRNYLNSIPISFMEKIVKLQNLKHLDIRYSKIDDRFLEIIIKKGNFLNRNKCTILMKINTLQKLSVELRDELREKQSYITLSI